MKTNIKSTLVFALIVTVFSACTSTDNSHGHAHEDHGGHAHEEGQGEYVKFSLDQFKDVGLKVDTLTKRIINQVVEVNGTLEVPPQNEAAVTSVVGGNITQIKVIEGDEVRKGQVLAMISHPDLIRLQTDYIDAWNQLEFKTSDYEREKKLYEENVGSGKKHQRSKAEYHSLKGRVAGMEAQLRLLHISAKSVREGTIYDQVQIVSPIKGFVRLVEVKMGQYVAPEKELFEIVNIDHVHADFMVYASDIAWVKKGQIITFKAEGNKGQEIDAEIYSVGKNFEQDPKAVHIHAEIENKHGLLLPGMYVRGAINVNDYKSWSLPEEAIVRQGDKHFTFTAAKMKRGEEVYWKFYPIEVGIGLTDQGWVAVTPIEPLKAGQKLVYNKAYYLMAELKKEEAEHSH